MCAMTELGGFFLLKKNKKKCEQLVVNLAELLREVATGLGLAAGAAAPEVVPGRWPHPHGMENTA